MITKLTEEQSALVSKYIDKWRDNGFRTDPIPFETTVSECRWIYQQFLKDHSPAPIVFLVASPLQAFVVANVVCRIIESITKKKSQLRSQLYSQLDSQLRSQLDSQLYSQLYSQLDSQLRSQLENQKSPKLEWKHYRADAWWYGGYYGFYDFVLEVLLPQKKSRFELFDRWRETLQRINWIIPLSGVCIAAQRPKELHFSNPDSSGLRRLHKDGGMAIQFEDGWGLHALNGVRVSKEIAETPADRLNAKILLKENNAQVRAEIVKKIGIERVMKDLNANIIDQKNGYELLMLNLGDGRNRPYLKMKNPSVDLVHIEGVHPSCDTVSKALAWRNGMIVYEVPQILT